MGPLNRSKQRRIRRERGQGKREEERCPARRLRRNRRTKEEIATGKEDTTLSERATGLTAAATWPRGNSGGATSPSSGSPSTLASA